MPDDLTPPPRRLMSVSMALRQAAIDIPPDLPPSARFAFATDQTPHGFVVTVVARTERGEPLWSQGYDAHGHRL